MRTFPRPDRASPPLPPPGLLMLLLIGPCSEPTRPEAPDPLRKETISASIYSGNICGMITSGAVYCWGEYEMGSMGNGASRTRRGA